MSYFFFQEAEKSLDRRWLLSSSSIAFATVGSHHIWTEEQFSFVDFIYDLLSFLRLVRSHFAAVHYVGNIQLWADLMFEIPAQISQTGIIYQQHVPFRDPAYGLGIGKELKGQGNAGSRIAMQPFTADSVLIVLKGLLNMIARCFGGVLRDNLQFLRPALYAMFELAPSRDLPSGPL
jgi:hypothetical protein